MGYPYVAGACAGALAALAFLRAPKKPEWGRIRSRAPRSYEVAAGDAPLVVDRIVGRRVYIAGADESADSAEGAAGAARGPEASEVSGRPGAPMNPEADSSPGSGGLGAGAAAGERFIAGSALGAAPGTVPGAAPLSPHPPTRTLIDFASPDFLSLACDRGSKDFMKAAVRYWGVGSCGPRGFFGTTTAHIALENELELFMNQPAIVYSSAATVIPSVVPVYCQPGDTVVIDRECSPEIRRAVMNVRGLVEARLPRAFGESAIQTWSEGSLDCDPDLAAVLRAREAPGAPPAGNLWLIVDSVTSDSALADLPLILHLARRYRLRILLNDSLGIGVLGATGRGLAEYWGDKGFAVSNASLDLVCASLETALGGVGGLCSGAPHLTEQQRNAGLGYCFSAAAPPSTCEVVRYNLRQVPARCAKLADKAEAFHRVLEEEGVPYCGARCLPVATILVPGGSEAASAVLQRMEARGYLCGPLQGRGIRVSIGHATEEEDMRGLARALREELREASEEGRRP